MSYRCNICRDEEFVITQKRYSEVYPETEDTDKGNLLMHVSTRCSCIESKAIDRSFKTSKITSEFAKRTFDNFESVNRPQSVKDAYSYSKAYAENFQEIKEEKHNSICLLGRPGCGKTHLLMAIANHLMTTKYLFDVIRFPTVQYFPWVEGFNEIKDDLSLTEERINRMQKVDVLYIDDMWKGRGKPTPFQLEQMFAVINYRYMEKKPVIISSERDIDEMCEFDEGIGSRINEMCKDFRIILKGGRELNYRLREDTE